MKPLPAGIRWLAMASALLLAPGAATHAADVPREVHGSADAFAAPAVALAWGVLRGADEATTMVTIRVVADASVHARVSVVGRDPFGQGERTLLAPTTTANLPDVVIPRSHFADFPRTELRFHRNAAGDAAPELVIFYLGVPDTTPEFTQKARLDAYLRERIARARNEPRSNTP